MSHVARLALGIILALAFTRAAIAADVSGEVYGGVGTGGATEVGGSITVGSGTHSDDDPAPPMTTPATPGAHQTGGAYGPPPPVIPDATTDAPPSIGDTSGH